MQQGTSFKFKLDLHFFPENERFKNEMIDYAHHCLYVVG
jgi:hypothetical protein